MQISALVLTFFSFAQKQSPDTAVTRSPSWRTNQHVSAVHSFAYGDEALRAGLYCSI